MLASALGVVRFTRHFCSAVVIGITRSPYLYDLAARIYSHFVGYHYWNPASGHDRSFERCDAFVEFRASS